jgi:hypothetical protein
MKLSARNVLPATVKAVTPGAVEGGDGRSGPYAQCGSDSRPPMTAQPTQSFNTLHTLPPDGSPPPYPPIATPAFAAR